MAGNVYTVIQESAANTSQFVTVAAMPGMRYCITGFSVTLIGANAAADALIVIRDNGYPIWREAIGSGALRGTIVHRTFEDPIKITAGNPLSLFVGGAGAGAITIASVSYTYERALDTPAQVNYGYANTATQDSTAGQANTITVAAVAGQSHYVTGFSAHIGAAAAGANDVVIALNDDSTLIWKWYIPASAARGRALRVQFTDPIKIRTGKAVSFSIGGAGAGVVTTANLSYYTAA
jgi:hypothetical protein